MRPPGSGGAGALFGAGGTDTRPARRRAHDTPPGQKSQII
ncbi:hypothetical protein SLNHY_2723 [Streptomyces albus]|nr:hypothetical protein SLNHY_2723 [Streptomyces albus]